MDKKEIRESISQVTTREELLDLLNIIHTDELSKMGVCADKIYPFTMKHLSYYCNPNHTFHRYRQFKIRKKSGGFRQITAPRNRSYISILRAINEILKATYTPSNYAMGFTEGRSVVTNAGVHKGQNYIFNIDLKDFFPSIEQPRIWKRLQIPPFNFTEEIASVIAGLCSMREIRTEEDGNEHYVYILPQGAPTSPIITNMICDKLDHRLAGLAKRFGLRYTRYADDITFSSMHYVYAMGGEFRKELERIIKDQGFTINETKTRLQKFGSRQEVTGIIVSNKLNVNRDYVRDIRNILYIWDRYGYSSAMAKFLPKYKMEKGHVKKGNPDLANVISGKLLYLKMVKGETDSVYTKLSTKFQALVNQDSAIEKTSPYGITYIETLPISTFEQTNKTTIDIISKDDGKRYGSFQFDEISQKATIMKTIPQENEQHKDKLAISNCRDRKGNQFWLIHEADKTTVSTHTAVNLEELNNDLDSLLSL